MFEIILSNLNDLQYIKQLPFQIHHYCIDQKIFQNYFNRIKYQTNLMNFKLL